MHYEPYVTVVDSERSILVNFWCLPCITKFDVISHSASSDDDTSVSSLLQSRQNRYAPHHFTWYTWVQLFILQFLKMVPHRLVHMLLHKLRVPPQKVSNLKQFFGPSYVYSRESSGKFV